MSTATHPVRKPGYLVVGGVSHDFDFVRLELLELLSEHAHLRVTVAADYEDIAAIQSSEFLISYSCDVRPSADAEQALSRFVQSGKRWFALHATNAHLQWTDAGVASAHTGSAFFTTLGSAFVAHPPMGRFRVDVAAPGNPLVEGIEPFEVEDELYLAEYFGQPEVLLATRFGGRTPGFVVDEWPDQLCPIMYVHRTGSGEVLYLNLGHARGHYDAPHRTPFYPVVERGAWSTPQFHELLRRGIRWVSRISHST
jgi:uncharacterized protein